MIDGELLRIYEKVAALEQISSAAHKRIDSFIPEVKASMFEIKTMIEKMMDRKDKELDIMSGSIDNKFDHLEIKVDELTASMNRGKGWAAAGILVAGLAGGALSKIVELILNK